MHPLVNVFGNLKRLLDKLFGFVALRNLVTGLIIAGASTGTNSLFAAVPAIGPTSVTPTSIPAAAPTLIMVTSTITDPSLIAGSVTLQRFNTAGKVLVSVGTMKDDGTNGDQVAGDKTFTLQFTVTEVPGSVLLRVSAAFRNNVKRLSSGLLTVSVAGAKTTALTTTSSSLDELQFPSTASVPSDIPFVSMSTDPTQTQDFESLRDLDVVTTQFSGQLFSNTIVLSSGAVAGSLNEFEFPPHSGSNVVSDNGGPISIVFQTPIRSFRAFFTYLVPVLVEALDANNNLLASARSAFAINLALSGSPGSVPNELLELNVATGFSKVRITGDPLGGSFTMDDMAVILLNQPPVCTHAAANPTTLWPPNHRLAAIQITGVTDPENDPFSITANTVFQDEPVDAPADSDGNTTPDATLNPLQVRMEREELGNGRVYHINFTASDDHGGTCQATVTVCMPHDLGQGSMCVDGGSLYNSTVP